MEKQKADMQHEKASSVSSHESDVSNEPHLSNAALKMRRYRQRLKNRGLWEDYRKKENEAIKKYKSLQSFTIYEYARKSYFHKRQEKILA